MVETGTVKARDRLAAAETRKRLRRMAMVVEGILADRMEFL